MMDLGVTKAIDGELQHEDAKTEYGNLTEICAV